MPPLCCCCSAFLLRRGHKEEKGWRECSRRHSFTLLRPPPPPPLPAADIKNEYDCFEMVQLPFAEDVRNFTSVVARRCYGAFAWRTRRKCTIHGGKEGAKGKEREGDAEAPLL